MDQDGMEIVDADAATYAPSTHDTTAAGSDSETSEGRITFEVSLPSDDSDCDMRDLPEVSDIFDFESVWLSLRDKTGQNEQFFQSIFGFAALALLKRLFRISQSEVDSTWLNLSHLRKKKGSVETTN